MTLFLFRGRVEEAARLSGNNKDLLFLATHFRAYLKAKTNSAPFRDINQTCVFLMNFAFALRDPGEDNLSSQDITQSHCSLQNTSANNNFKQLSESLNLFKDTHHTDSSIVGISVFSRSSNMLQ